MRKRLTSWPFKPLIISERWIPLTLLRENCNKVAILTYLIWLIFLWFFVFLGLCTLVGIILYIGSITEEVGSKGKPSGDEKVQFKYNYGASFIMTVCSFVLTELSGVFSVYLYITRYKQKHRKKLQQMFKGEQNDRGNRWRYRKPTNHSRERSASRDRCSRDHSMSRSDSYYTYTPISDNVSNELSNYTFPREVSRNTISTTVDTHAPPRDHRDHVVRENNTRELMTVPLPPEAIVRRTTPVWLIQVDFFVNHSVLFDNQTADTRHKIICIIIWFPIAIFKEGGFVTFRDGERLASKYVIFERMAIKLYFSNSSRRIKLQWFEYFDLYETYIKTFL